MSQINRRQTLFAVVAIGVLGSLQAPPAMGAAGEVLALTGSAFFLMSTEQRAVVVGDPVQTGDTIDVPQDAKVRLRMNDGSILTVASGTRMTISKYDVDGTGNRQDAELAMSSGLLRAVVSAGGGTPNFEVKTATGVAAVRGTEWYVAAQGDTTQVYVITGSVSLADSMGHNLVTIPSMAVSSVDLHKAPTRLRPITQAELRALVERTAFYVGLCQCIETGNDVLARCRPTTEECQAYCGGGHYSFVPQAPESCGQP